MIKQRNRFLFIIALIVILMAAWLHFLYAPRVTDPKGYIYYLRPGANKSVAISDLAQAGIVPHTWLNALYIYPQITAYLKQGEYLFPKGANVISIWQQLTQGKGLYYRPFLIVPGWTFQQLRVSLNQTPTLRHDTLTWSDARLMQKLGGGNNSPEGQFFPETYRYARDVSDIVILKQAFVLMQQKLNQVWLTRAANLPYNNAYDALIAASLIEKEAYLDSERPIIAGVLVNRMNHNMLLQIDPTVIYGMGAAYTGLLHKSDLLYDSVYNTYLHKGLPPTPIAMPGMASLFAALHPATHDYYYYVARGDGSHVFSKTLVEQQAAIAHYEHQSALTHAIRK